MAVDHMGSMDRPDGTNHMDRLDHSDRPDRFDRMDHTNRMDLKTPWIVWTDLKTQ